MCDGLVMDPKAVKAEHAAHAAQLANTKQELHDAAKALEKTAPNDALRRFYAAIAADSGMSDAAARPAPAVTAPAAPTPATPGK